MGDNNPTNNFSPTDLTARDLPQVPVLCDTEEIYEKLPQEDLDAIITEGIPYFATRCAVTSICLLGTIMIIVGTARSHLQRYKSWRLYLLTSLMILSWTGLTLYRDYIDEYFVHEIWRQPSRYIIYYCIQNLAQGLSLYTTVLLLSHLSDFQHRGSWLWLIAMVILVPLVFSVVHLVAQLFLPHRDCKILDENGNEVTPEYTREGFLVTTAAETIKVAFYNVATTILLLVFSRNLCTRRLYGTYSNHRSPLVILISRWTFAFLVLHNLTAMARYGAYMATKEEVCVTCFETAQFVQKILDEVALFLIVLAVPGSYLIALLCQGICGIDDDRTSLEMDKIDKVWTPTAGSTTTQIQNQPLPQPTVQTLSAPPVARNAMPSSNPAGGASRNGSQAGTGPNTRTGSQSTLTSIDSLGELPPSSANRRPASRHSNRQSYMEAVSMGSLDGSGSDRYSVTTDPVDL